MKLAILLVVAVCLGAFGIYWVITKEKSYPWLVFYGEAIQKKATDKVRLAILDPDQIQATTLKPTATKLIGYISVGEAEPYRAYWEQVKNSSFLVEKNPVWGSYLVDIRSSPWQELLLHRVIPKILELGYDGIFLDTVDTAFYLEEKDPERFEGSKRALVQLIKKIREIYPALLIYMNNGLEVLDDVAITIDGVVVEDLYTHYDFEKQQSFKTADQLTNAKEKILDSFVRKTQKKVLTILYAPREQYEVARYAIKRCRQKGYHWYLSDINLQSMGHIGR